TRVARRRRDARVDPRRLQPHRGMLAIVERMKRVVGGAWVLRVAFEDRLRDRAGLQRYRGIALTRRNRRDEGERMERGGFIVLRKRARELAHAARVRLVARSLVSCTEEPLNGIDVALLARRERLPRPRQRQPPQRVARLVETLVVPERLVVAHRL